MKPEGEDIRDHLMKKYGPEAVARYGQPGNSLYVAGEKVGITFKPDRRIVPTMDCHRAIEWCKSEYKDDEKKADLLMESMFKSYFTNNVDISKIPNIASIASEVDGIDAEKLKVVLEDKDALKAEVNENVRTFQNGLNIRGVPFFIIHGEGNEKPVAFSGAQPVEIIAEQLKQACGEE